ncbi:MAG: ATP-dependent sacrificial sulfur transferase LarE [Coriobacteriia bacterium]|nr:ATP-dependent sacrificial sulfur transferase LarE [Coriobacteriia bacterium]
MNSQLQEKESLLRSNLQAYGSVAIALSGGVDSTLLLDVAHEVLGQRAVAITATMASFPARELSVAMSFCSERGIPHSLMEFDELAVEGFASNPPERCYLCKRGLLTAMLALASKLGFEVLAEGSNLDDDFDYRPGAKAVRELGVASPLKEAGFTKADIRKLAKFRGLAAWDKPAFACLSTRLPSGTPLTKELLRRIDEAEQCILSTGARQVRVRIHENLARIEVDEESMLLLMERPARQQVVAALQALGFDNITLDLQGYRTGSMNERR